MTHYYNFVTQPAEQMIDEMRVKLEALEMELAKVHDHATLCEVPRNLYDTLLIVPPDVYDDVFMHKQQHQEQLDSIWARFHIPNDVIMPPHERRHA